MNELTASEDSDHDWSKDEVYMVIIALRYLLGRGDLVKDICEREIEHHYRHEIHVPEHVSYTWSVMDDMDIMEMAIDRLARILQFNNGNVNWELVNQFLPHLRWCPHCDNPKGCEHERHMVERFKYFVKINMRLVRKRWKKSIRETFPNFLTCREEARDQ